MGQGTVAEQRVPFPDMRVNGGRGDELAVFSEDTEVPSSSSDQVLASCKSIGEGCGDGMAGKKSMPSLACDFTQVWPTPAPQPRSQRQ